MLNKYPATTPDFVNTSDAYSKDMFIGQGNIVIPYINLGLMPNNPINQMQSVIDFSYYVFMNLKSLSFSINGEKLDIENIGYEIESSVIEYVLVFDSQTNSGQEVIIECDGLFLYYPKNAILASPEVPFIPYDVPNYKRNLNEENVQTFFSFGTFPDELKELLGKRVHKIAVSKSRE